MMGRHLALLLFLLLPICSAQRELEGTHFRGCTLLEFPYVKQSEFGHASTQNFSGVAIDYLEALRDHAGFTITLVLWNRTFREFVDHMGTCAVNGSTAGCECDMGVGAFTMTNDRVAKIDFLWPFANENHRMISRASDLKPDGDSNLTYMFNTFSWPVWALIAVAVFVYALGTAAFGDIAPVNRERYPNFRPVLRARRTALSAPARQRAIKRQRSAPIDQSSSSVTVHLPPPGYPSGDQGYEMGEETTQEEVEKPHIFVRIRPRLQRLAVAFVYTFAMFIGHPQDTDASRVSSVHRIAWRLLSITAGVFLFCLYNASLTVLLFESVKESRFKSLEDVKECVIHPKSVTFIRGGASEDLWRNAITNRGLCQTPHKPRVRAKSIEDGLQLLRERKADFFYSLEGAVLSVAHRRCDEFAIVGEPFFSTSIGFIVPKGSKYKEPLSRSTRILREQDAFYSARTIAMRSPCQETSAATISLSRLIYFFVAYFVVAVGLILYRIYFMFGRTHR